MVWVLLLTLLVVHSVDSQGQSQERKQWRGGRQGFCKNPHNGQSIFCDNLQEWDEISRSIDVPEGTSILPALANGEFMSLNAVSPGALPATKYDCLNWQCVCNFLTGASWDGSRCNLPGPSGAFLSNRPRAEIRTFTTAQLAQYAAGFRAAYADIYDYLSYVHSTPSQSPAAHSGPAFLPWHREFCKRMEIGIRTAYVGGQYPYWAVTIPFWDNELDQNTVNVFGISGFNSVMFSAWLMGSVRSGTLTNGMFGGWSGRQGATRRAIDTLGVSLMQASDVNNMINSHTVNQVLAATSGGSGCPSLPFNTLELMHGNPHVWIGAHMSSIPTSTNDPIFFSHHALIDCIWEYWRLARQSPSQRETQYTTVSTSCYSSGHRASAVMQPFSNGGFINSDGLSNLYTQQFYTCAARPSSSYCPGPFLVIVSGQCCSRLKPGSRCRRIGGVDPCYASSCSSTSTAWGTCVATSSDVPEQDIPKPPETAGKVDESTHELCFNNHECCGTWAKQGECKKNPAMKVACKAACGVCKTKYKCMDNCADRHPLCDLYNKEGQCQKNPYFMNENCRKTCGACGQKRSEVCKAAPKPGDTPTKKKGYAPNPTSSKKGYKPISGCYNSNVCCQHWKMNVGCSKMGILTKVCQASCLCKPKYDLMTCKDFLGTCKQAKKQGLCGLDQIKENCRQTCGSCPSPEYLAKKC